MLIPKAHPRAESLRIREKLVQGYREGLVVEEGLLAHGRGEMFDYIIGEKTTRNSQNAIKAAARELLTAKFPVISVNGNFAALCAKEIVQLSKVTGAEIEVNLFYSSNKRKKVIARTLRNYGANKILGINPKQSTKISRLDSARRIVDRHGIFSADVVLVPLEDGDRTVALKKIGKRVITFDLNPLSRTSKTADITIVDNVTRGMQILVSVCKQMSGKKFQKKIQFNNKKNLGEAASNIKNNLGRLAHV